MPTEQYEETVTFKAFPTARWFLDCYVRDVWGRIEMLKAAMTSVYGTVLKIDSTKKVIITLFLIVLCSLSFSS